MKLKNSHEINLILIIGTNPLPNYVVLKYFLDTKRINKIYLIHSEYNNNQVGTFNYAERIKKLVNEQIPNLIPLSDISSVNKINQDLKKKLKKNLKYESKELNISNNEIIHLNYTGGTKLMAIHIYNFINNEISKERYHKQYSYLDARNFRIFYDDGSCEPTGKKDLREYVKLNISTMLKLHLYEEYNCEESLSFKYVLEKIKNLIINDKINDLFKFVKDIKPLYEEFKKNKFLEKVNDPCFQEHINAFNAISDEILEILNAFPPDKRLNKDGKKQIWIPDERITKNFFKNRVKYSLKYLDGVWLEDYVYNELKLKLNDYSEEQGNIGHSLRARKKDELDPNNYVEFELDIFLINGYQLIGISITTENKKGLCKLKGFEIIHRVRQIGGDEAIAVLITALDDDKKLELKEDLFYSTGSSYDKILVYGINDWKDIGKKIVEDCKL